MSWVGVVPVARDSMLGSVFPLDRAGASTIYDLVEIKSHGYPQEKSLVLAAMMAWKMIERHHEATVAPSVLQRIDKPRTPLSLWGRRLVNNS